MFDINELPKEIQTKVFMFMSHPLADIIQDLINEWKFNAPHMHFEYYWGDRRQLSEYAGSDDSDEECDSPDEESDSSDNFFYVDDY